MLGVGLRKLCPHESFGYAFREKNGPKIDPRRVQHRPAGVQSGLREASGQLFFASWAQLGRSEAVVAALGALLGRL